MPDEMRERYEQRGATLTSKQFWTLINTTTERTA
jgi:hypothetical protein